MAKYAELMKRQLEGIGRKPSTPLDLTSLLMALYFMQGDKEGKGNGAMTPNQEALVSDFAKNFEGDVMGKAQGLASSAPVAPATPTQGLSFWDFINAAKKPAVEGMPTNVPGFTLAGIGKMGGESGVPFSLSDPSTLPILRLLGIIP